MKRYWLVALVVLTAVRPVAAQSPADEKPPAATGKKHPANRLARETSPYLLLHAHNPVDWHPWGPEALAKAKQENKLIFLSVGYSSCYWCHVMERESFTDEEIAAFVNKHFVCIKVDREERPDVDEIYMTALRIYYQLVGVDSSGGWPLSMFLTPDVRPIAGGTYMPPRDRAETGMTGFLTISRKLEQLWRDNPDQVNRAAEQLTELVKANMERRSGLASPLPDKKVFDELAQALGEQYDPRHGGFGFSDTNPRQPKFPEPSNLVFLLDRLRRQDDPQLKKMLVGTLEQMAAGGIRDHLGGGFHRYSTDRYWRIPHFEKMLYDNAQLASVYAEAYAITKDERFKQVVEEIAAWLFREMVSPEGAFYSALDAETDAEEGRYYVWTKAELDAALTPEELAVLARTFDVAGEPNFEEKYYALVQRAPSVAEVAGLRERNAGPQTLASSATEAQLAPVKAKLLAARQKRGPPLTDTKILTSWNGLMIRGLADAGRLLEKPQYIAAAERAAEFILGTLRTKEGRLLRTYGGGQAKLNAYLDDYAFLADGLIALHRATGDQRWLNEADALTRTQLEWFWDEKGGSFFFTSSDHEELLARGKNLVDTAIPSGAAVSAGNLVYLARQLKRDSYLDRAEQVLRDAAPLMNRAPSAMPRMIVSLAELLDARAAAARVQ